MEQVRKGTDEAFDHSILEAVISNIGTGFVVADTSGNIVAQNEPALRMHDFRYEHEELSNLEEFKKTFRLEYPDGGSVPFEKWPLSRALHGDYFRDFIVKMINPASRSRKVRYISYNTVPIYDKRGVKKFIVITMTDLSDIHERTEALHESEMRYHSLFNNTTLGISHCRIITDEEGRPEDYVIIQINEAYSRISGIGKKEIEGKKATEVFKGIKDHSFDFIRQYGKVALEGVELVTDIFDERFNKWISLYAYSPKPGEFTSIFNDISQRKEMEDRLSREEQRFRSLFTNVAIGIVEVDSEDRIISVNDRICEILGYTREELLMMTVYDITIPEDRARSYQTNALIHSGEKGIVGYEKRYQKKDNTALWVHVTISGVYDSAGRHLSSVGTVEDITERKKSEEALKRSESIMKHAGIMANLGAWELGLTSADRIEGNPLHWSEQVYRIFGYEPGEVNVTTGLFYERVHPDDRKRVMDAVREALDVKKPYTIEHRIIWENGSVRTVIENAETTFDNSGRPVRMIGAVQDITERVRTLEALAESEEKFRSLFENITEGVALHEVIYNDNQPADFSIIETNSAFREYFDMNGASINGKPARDLYIEKGLPVSDKYFDVAETRQIHKFETSVGNPGKHFIVNVISPKTGQFATVFEDITDQKRNEIEIRQKNEELTRFIYTVSHDLKSPLVTISSFSNYLQEDIANNDMEAQARDLNFIRNAADKMGKLLDELLELSRIGRKEKPKEKVRLNEIIQAATDLVAGRIDEGKITVKFTGDDTVLFGHGQRFVQLFQNLIDNAAKFMGNQRDPVIEIGSFKNEDSEIVLYVRDNGRGIDPRYHHKIFGLFEKMDNDTEGTGIGLALVKRIVEVHGGRIWFNSGGEGTGTTFYFTLEGTTLTS
jgi:PAS domain S-box-containing protein